MTDFHCHILPGLDDGSDSLTESLEMARLLAKAGYGTVYCTPHCMKGVFETSPEQVRAGVATLQAELDREGIGLKLEAGMEYCLDEFFNEELDRLLPLGDTKMVLVEAPNHAEPGMLKEQIFQLTRRRYTPLIAHPERTPIFRSEPDTGIIDRLRGWFSTQNSKLKTQNSPQLSTLDELRTMGCRLQCNLGSLSGFYGPEVKKQAEGLKGAGIYHCYGTDAHRSSQVRGFGVLVEGIG